MKQKKFKMCETNRYIFGTWGVTHFFFIEILFNISIIYKYLLKENIILQ